MDDLVGMAQERSATKPSIIGFQAAELNHAARRIAPMCDVVSPSMPPHLSVERVRDLRSAHGDLLAALQALHDGVNRLVIERRLEP